MLKTPKEVLLGPLFSLSFPNLQKGLFLALLFVALKDPIVGSTEGFQPGACVQILTLERQQIVFFSPNPMFFMN